MPERLVDFARNEGVMGKEKMDLLSKKTVAVIGVGSLGSEITRLLAMTGVGKFILIDPDKLEPVNIVRHVLGVSKLGGYKVASMRDYLVQERNPEASVFGVVGKAEEQPDLLAKSDLVILSSLGFSQKEQLIASELRKRGATVLVAGVYGKGIGGEIFLVKPDTGPCHSCFMEYLKDTSKLKERKPIYGMNPGEVEAVPALAIHINRIATLTADFAIKTLVNDHISPEYPEINLLIFANSNLSIGSGESHQLAPLQIYLDIVSQNPNCSVCNGINLSDIREDLDIFGMKGGEEDANRT